MLNVKNSLEPTYQSYQQKDAKISFLSSGSVSFLALKFVTLICYMDVSPILEINRGEDSVEQNTLRRSETYDGFAKPYSAAGFCTRMRLRVFSSGTHFINRSNSTASSGFFGSFGCGQLLPQTMRSGAALTYA